MERRTIGRLVWRACLVQPSLARRLRPWLAELVPYRPHAPRGTPPRMKIRDARAMLRVDDCAQVEDHWRRQALGYDVSLRSLSAA